MEIVGIRRWVRRVIRAHEGLPVLLRLPMVAVETLGLVIVLGLGCTLPPGPLCDEGMWRFMEGGCDWGESNVFFHGKLGLLLVTNAVLAAGLFLRRLQLRAFLPHAAALTLLAMAPWLSDAGKCETYYGHPNGNLARMVLEVAAFAGLGLAALGPLRAHRAALRVAGLLAVNAVNVALFQLALSVTPHWTWEHTALVVAGEVALALALTARFRAPRGLRTTHVLVVLAGSVALLPLRATLETPLNVMLAALLAAGAFLTARELWRARI